MLVWSSTTSSTTPLRWVLIRMRRFRLGMRVLGEREARAQFKQAGRRCREAFGRSRHIWGDLPRFGGVGRGVVRVKLWGRVYPGRRRWGRGKVWRYRPLAGI